MFLRILTLVQMDRILKEERNYILSMIKKIRATGCNVLLIQKSILRDAVTDLSLHYLAKAKILVVKVRHLQLCRLCQDAFFTVDFLPCALGLNSSVDL